MATAAFLIYSGVMPLVKMFITIFFGFLLAKKDLFPPAASRGASQITMNVSLPCLIFANIVPAFTPANVSAIGPLMLIAIVYELIGFSFGLIIREVLYVPRNFWQGIVIICGMSNWGNLPNAVVMSVTQQAPFNPETDTALGVSFVAIFIVVYHITFWAFGAAHSLSWDYLPGVPQGEQAEQRMSWKQKPIGGFIARHLRGVRAPQDQSRSASAEPDKEKQPDAMLEDARASGATVSILPADGTTSNEQLSNSDPDVQLARRITQMSAVSQRQSLNSPKLPVTLIAASAPINAQSARPAAATSVPGTTLPMFLPPTVRRALQPLVAVITPVTMSLAISLPIALIQPLKALFVDTTSTGGPAWHGPDGRPPLSFVIDTANFLGGIVIPLALILLGASFARLHIPRPISRLPIAAMLSVAAAKMVLLPVIGVFIVQAMVRGGMIDRDAKAERFVAVFLSGTPAAVNQLIVSQLYSPDGDVDTLSAFLLVQYVIMFISSSALTAVSLLLL